MITIVNRNDTLSVKNIDAVLGLYELMITQKKGAEATEKYLRPDYIQHNPIIPTGAKNLGVFFDQISVNRANLGIVVHKIVAVGDYVWAHVNFLNLYNDDPNDRGIAGVDMYRFDADGKIAEHWDVLQEVPDREKAANSNTMF